MSECADVILGPELAGAVTTLILVIGKLIRDKRRSDQKVKELHEDLEVIANAIAGDEETDYWDEDDAEFDYDDRASSTDPVDWEPYPQPRNTPPCIRFAYLFEV